MDPGRDIDRTVPVKDRILGTPIRGQAVVNGDDQWVRGRRAGQHLVPQRLGLIGMAGLLFRQADKIERLDV